MSPNLGQKKVLCQQNEKFILRDLNHFHNKPINGLEAPIENQSGVDNGVDFVQSWGLKFLSPLDGCYIIHKGCGFWVLMSNE